MKEFLIVDMILKIMCGIRCIFLFQCTNDSIEYLEGEWHISPNSFFEIQKTGDLDFNFISEGDTFSVFQLSKNDSNDVFNDVFSFSNDKMSASIKPLDSIFLLFTLYKVDGEIDEVFIASKGSYNIFNQNTAGKVFAKNLNDTFIIPEVYSGRIFVVFDQDKDELIKSSIGLVYIKKSKVDRLSYLLDRFNFENENNIKLCVTKDSDSQNYIYNSCQNGVFLHGFNQGRYRDVLNELQLEGEVLVGVVK